MTIKARACVKCHGATRLATVERMSGSEKALAVTVHDLPVLACEQGHTQFVRAEFPLHLIEALLTRDQLRLPAARAKGLLFKHYHCSNCSAQLDAGPGYHHTLSVPVALPELPPFSVDVSLPLWRCGACGKRQLQSTQAIEELLPVALAHAFQAAQIPHA